MVCHHLAKRLITTLANTQAAKSPDSKSFCLNLFRGKAVLDQTFPYPLKLNDSQKETLQMVQASLVQFLTEVNDPFKNDENASIPREVLDQFAQLGGLGVLVPEEYEGAGMQNSQMARLAELIGEHDLSLGVIMAAHQSIGYKGILLYGTDAQKKKYLPDVATGRKFAAFCLTEPSAGSDANSLETRAVKSPCGKHYVINGGKIWISNGGFADIFTVFAKTPMKQADGTTKDKVSAFIVERAFGGVTSGPPEKKMGIKGSNTAEVHFEDVKVPVENLLGEEGNGFKIAMNILNNGRFGLPAACVGTMKAAIDKTVDHINTRVQFGKKLKEFGNVQEQLADMVLRHYVTESIVYMLAANMDSGIKDFQLEAAIAKVVSSDNAWHVLDRAIQLHGGMGFMRETGLERMMRDLRIFRIFEGANDVMKLFVSAQGIQYLAKQLKHLSTGGLRAIVGEVKRRTIGGIGANIAEEVHPSLAEGADVLSSSIKQFGSTVETLLKTHREKVGERQYELMRVANAVLDIYGIAAVLSRCTKAIREKDPSAAQQVPIVRLFIRQAAERINRNLAKAATPDTADIELIRQVAEETSENKIRSHPISM